MGILHSSVNILENSQLYSLKGRILGGLCFSNDVRKKKSPSGKLWSKEDMIYVIFSKGRCAENCWEWPVKPGGPWEAVP